MYALVDCNNFYASCERVFNPNLNDKPIVVLSNNDGCVISRSNEAKEEGIPMGAPAFKYQELFDQKKVHVFSSNYALYGDLSGRVMNLLSEYTPDIEIYSIDEAFLHFKGFDNYNLAEYGKTISKRVKKSTGIPISIGIAPTKTLSKVANKIAKKFSKFTDGVHVINTDEKRIKALKWIRVEDIWGIGGRYAKRLNSMGVFTGYQFIQLPDAWIRKNMAVVGLRLKRDLEGMPTLSLEDTKRKKAIATTRSFHRNYKTFSDVKERVSTFAITCAEKLRKQKSCCNLVMVFLHTNGHRKDLAQYNRNIVIKTDCPTNSSIDLIKYCSAGLKAIYKEGHEYKKAGVIVMGLTPENQKQLNFFVSENLKHQKLLSTIDKLNKDIGQQKLRFGCQDLGRTWKMRQEKLSPRYSTRIDEILTVNCNVFPFKTK